MRWCSRTDYPAGLPSARTWPAPSACRAASTGDSQHRLYPTPCVDQRADTQGVLGLAAPRHSRSRTAFAAPASDGDVAYLFLTADAMMSAPMMMATLTGSEAIPANNSHPTPNKRPSPRSHFPSSRAK